MCGKCEPVMQKGGLGLGILNFVLAVVTRLSDLSPMGLGPRSFAAASALFLLLAIAVGGCNCSCGHSHDAKTG